MNNIQKIHVLQGEFRVAIGRNVVLSTVLGSCVAACLRDPEAGVGGMNHFLLPGASESGDQIRYGAYLMELLINGMLKKGARRERILAKVFGGARMLHGLSDIGSQNAEFAKRYLKDEGIRVMVESLGGIQGRRIEFFPATGCVRQILLPRSSGLIAVSAPSRSDSGSLELF